ncbi:glucuronide permease [Streptococcus oralis]|uniref:Glucuronide permease n=1 Tax=Streptococcus oralis subsp. dentisani TaxID=1458253 RepID=A0A1X1J2Q7_STROR|nr:glucuronide permease [Streptococcus oralis]ORO79674.1 glucuronide permease [Streptococcus oralis subsp. dentisani]
MLTSIILGILTIVLALIFSLLHLAVAFAAMKQKNYSLGNTCILVGSCLTSLALAIFFFVPLVTIILWIAGSSIICYGAYWNGRQQENQHISHHIIRGTLAALIALLFILL